MDLQKIQNNVSGPAWSCKTGNLHLINSLEHITILSVLSHPSNDNSLWSVVTMMVWLTSGQGQLGKARPWGVDFTSRARLANHVTGDQMAVEDVPSGRDEATAMTHPIQCVRMHLKVALTVCFSGERWQTDETDKWTLTYGRTERDNKATFTQQILVLNSDILVRSDFFCLAVYIIV